MKDKPREELAVCGLKATLKLAEIHPERISRLFFTEATAPLFKETCKRLAAERKLYRLVAREDLEKLAKSSHHQDCVAMIEPPEIEAAEPALGLALKAGEPFVVLDGIGNAHNLGAIARSCAFFGVGKILISGDDAQASITTGAYRVAEGGMEFVRFFRTNDLAAAMKSMKQDAFFLGADHRGKAGFSEAKRLAKGDKALGIVLGNEENGISSQVRRQCDALARVPGAGHIESLNVSVAAGIFLAAVAAGEGDASGE